MSINELERVKQDIATIKEAAGLELPFGWDYAWLFLFAPPALGVWFLAYWLIADTPSRYVVAAQGLGHRSLRLLYCSHLGALGCPRDTVTNPMLYV